MLANVVVSHKLDAAEEIDRAARLLESFYERYLDAYNQQTSGRSIN